MESNQLCQIKLPYNEARSLDITDLVEEPSDAHCYIFDFLAHTSIVKHVLQETLTGNKV
jgi:hypothetical protein